MKLELINFLKELNALHSGRLIEQNINNYVEKVYKLATIHEIKKDGNIIAFIAYYDNDKKRNTAFLSILAIHTKFQNLGYGKLLLNEAVENLKQNNFERFDLEVLKSNIKAIKLYKKNGFQIIGEIGDKYKMRKLIQKC